MIRRISALFLVLAMTTTLALCSCGDSESKGDTAATEAELTEFEMDESVVIDNDDCKLTVTGLEQCVVEGSERRAHELSLALENRTEETEIIFYIESAYVNGIEWKSFFSEFVAAGESNEATVYFGTNEFGDAEIDVVSEIEIKFAAYDNTNGSSEVLGEGSVHLYPKIAE